MSGIIHDLRYAARSLARTPTYTAIVLVVFAVGIGATTAMLSVVDAFFVRPLPVAHAGRVMTVWQYNRETGASQQDVAPGNAIDWMKRMRSFEQVAMAEGFAVNFLGREPGYIEAARVGEHFFTVLGTPMLHGRAFLPEEYRPGAGRVAIFSYSMWRDHFGSDVSIVGQPVRMNDAETYAVVGVLPPGFELRLFEDRSKRPEPFVWLPKQGFTEFEPNMRGIGFWNVIGRLKPDVSVEQAQAEFDTISAQLAREHPQTNRNIAAQVVPLRDHLVGSLRNVLPLFLGAAGLLLAAACANVANLLLARGAGRGREFAVRQALGASRGRLMRQMLAESLLLATAGGAIGLVLTRWTLDVIARLRPMDVARVDQIPIDARAVVIVFGVIIVAAIVTGLMPSIQLSRPAAASALKEARSSSRRGTRGTLVIVEVAAAVVLAVGAGLLIRSFVLIQRVDPGFRPEHVSAVQVFASPRLDTAQKRIAFFQQALDRMRALPGVVAAGGVTTMPFGEAKVIIRAPFMIVGRPPASAEPSQVYTIAVAGDYFQAMGVPLLKGRLFDATDMATSRQVVVVSRNAAQQFWPGADPIGSRVQFRFTGTTYDAEVVGVVGDVRHEALDQPAPPELFLPYAQSGFRALTFVVRAAPGSPVPLQSLKEQIWALDPQQSIFTTATLDDWVSRSLVGRRFSLFLLGGFALATLLLASAGIYGVMSFSTSQRTREFGVRMALGALRADIMAMVLRDGLKLAGIGVLIGTLLALPLAQLLRTMLFGVTTTDPVTFSFVTLAVVLLAAAASYVPASRALRIHPAEALRTE